MSKASKRQKLTKEELKEENKKLRRQVVEGYTTPEDRQRIVDTLSMRNIGAYALVLFLPPVGIWYVWTRREELHLNNTSVLAWTFVGIVCLMGYIQLIMQGA